MSGAVCMCRFRVYLCGCASQQQNVQRAGTCDPGLLRWGSARLALRAFMAPLRSGRRPLSIHGVMEGSGSTNSDTISGVLEGSGSMNSVSSTSAASPKFGWLLKSSGGKESTSLGNVLAKWDKRWFVLLTESSTLQWYRSERDAQHGRPAAGGVECAGSRIVRVTSSGSTSSSGHVEFVLHTESRTLGLRANSEEDFAAWAAAVVAAGGSRGACDGQPMAPAAAPPAQPVADLDEVLAQARIGDVLLFKCTFAHTVVLRALTSWRYDHVAVVAEDDDGELCLLEACGAGVLAMPLELRVHQYRLT
jgi:hypothetical protein